MAAVTRRKTQSIYIIETYSDNIRLAWATGSLHKINIILYIYIYIYIYINVLLYLKYQYQSARTQQQWHYIITTDSSSQATWIKHRWSRILELKQDVENKYMTNKESCDDWTKLANIRWRALNEIGQYTLLSLGR